MLKGTVTQIQDQTATVTLADGQFFRLPAGEIEGQAVTGMTVHLVVAAPGSEDAARQKLSKDLLNEIMGS